MEDSKRPYIARYDFDIAASQSVVKSFVALVQLYSIIKVLKADTLRDYGAYQLTLIPYALMSFINITSGFVTPSYPAVYMVRSKVMEEAERRGGFFDGCVGILDEDEKEKTFFRKTRCEFAASPRIVREKNKLQLETKWAKFKRLLTHAIHQRKKRNIISLGKLWVAKDHTTDTALRSITYFHHLKRSLPLVRFIEVNLKQLQHTISSETVFSKAFKNHYNEQDPNSNYYFVFQIGNSKHREAAKKWMPLCMDIVMLVGLALPWVSIYLLTRFKSPEDLLHGIFFMLWLLLGQLLPFLLIPSWSLINLKVRRIKLNQAILASSLCVSLTAFAALGGFYFVGEMRYQELAQHNYNCCKSQTTQ